MSLIDSEQHAHKSLTQQEVMRLVDYYLVSHDLHLLEVEFLLIRNILSTSEFVLWGQFMSSNQGFGCL